MKVMPDLLPEPLFTAFIPEVQQLIIRKYLPGDMLQYITLDNRCINRARRQGIALFLFSHYVGHSLPVSRFQLCDWGDEITAFLPAVYQVFIQQAAVGIFNCRLADGKVTLQPALAGELLIIFKLSVDDLLPDCVINLFE